RLTGKKRGKPGGGRTVERSIAKVRPLVLSSRAQETNAVAELELRLAPRQTSQSELGNAVGEQARGFLARHHRAGFAGQRDGVEAAYPTGPQRRRTWIKFDLVPLADPPAR